MDIQIGDRVRLKEVFDGKPIGTMGTITKIDSAGTTLLYVDWDIPNRFGQINTDVWARRVQVLRRR